MDIKLTDFAVLHVQLSLPKKKNEGQVINEENNEKESIPYC